MKRARDVIGLPIICVQSGKQVGNARDFLLSDSWEIEALLLETKHWFSEATCIHWKDVIALGTDAVTISSADVIRPMDEAPEVTTTLLSGARKIKGLPVLTVNGQQLGVIEDVYLEPEWGKKVIGYELTEGFISDLKDGRKWLPLPDTVTVGEDAIIVPVNCSEALEEIFVPKEE